MQTAVHAGLVIAAVVVARAGRHQVDAAHAYGHRARDTILAATPSLSAPRAEDRYECRQRSYRVVPVNAARIPVCTCSWDRRLASSSFTTSRSRLHGSDDEIRAAPTCSSSSPRDPVIMILEIPRDHCSPDRRRSTRSRIIDYSRAYAHLSVAERQRDNIYSERFLFQPPLVNLCVELERDLSSFV